jgi:hypothetical protein
MSKNIPISDSFDLKKRFFWKAYLLRKMIYTRLKTDKTISKKILFIIGCQRSGTTLMTKIFERDINAKVYGEFSELSSNDRDKIRLNPLDSVKNKIDKNKLPLIILKPLVETQNSRKLLNYFYNSKALWLFRHYKDVAFSNINIFGIKNGISNLRPIVNREIDNWRSEYVSKPTRATVLKYFSEDMNPYDAACLFWYARNKLLFELGLDTNSDVMLCKYEELVVNPFATMQRVYKFLNHMFPGKKIVIDVHTKSVSKGKNIEISPEVEKVCEEMLQKLNSVYKSAK